MATTFNLFDLIFIFAAIIIIAIAFLRGFAREICALIAWILAILISYYLAPYTTDFASKYSQNPVVTNIVSTILVFMIIFIITALSLNKLGYALKEKMPTILDQILGILYGALKTLLIFGLIYSFTANLYSVIYQNSSSEDAEKSPKWLYESRCRKIIEGGAKILDPVVKKFVDSIFVNFDVKKISEEKKSNEVNKIESSQPKHKKNKKEIISPLEEANSTNQIDKNSKTNESEKLENTKEKAKLLDKSKSTKAVKTDNEFYDDKGYSRKEIEKMNRLIEIVE